MSYEFLTPGAAASAEQQAIERMHAGMVAKPVSPAFMDWSLARAQDKAFSQALGGTFRQLGLERPHAEGSNFLRPDQIGALLKLRGGSGDAASAQTLLSLGARANPAASYGVEGVPGVGRTPWGLIAGGVGVVLVLVLLLRRRR